MARKLFACPTPSWISIRSSNDNRTPDGGLQCSARSTPPNGVSTNPIVPLDKSSLPLMSRYDAPPRASLITSRRTSGVTRRHRRFALPPSLSRCQILLTPTSCCTPHLSPPIHSMTQRPNVAKDQLDALLSEPDDGPFDPLRREAQSLTIDRISSGTAFGSFCNALSIST